MTLDTWTVIESGEGLAVLHGEWSLGPPSATQGMSTEVLRRQPDGRPRVADRIEAGPLPLEEAVAFSSRQIIEGLQSTP